MTPRTTPAQEAQIAYCRRMLAEGETPDDLLAKGYAAAAIKAAQEKRI